MLHFFRQTAETMHQTAAENDLMGDEAFHELSHCVRHVARPVPIGKRAIQELSPRYRVRSRSLTRDGRNVCGGL